MGKKLSKEAWTAYNTTPTSPYRTFPLGPNKHDMKKTPTMETIGKMSVINSVNQATSSWNTFEESYARGDILSFEDIPPPPGDIVLVKGFMPAPLPPNENERLAALWRYGLMHSRPNDVFQDFVKRVREHYRVKMCMISLVSSNYQWFLGEDGSEDKDKDRDASFCAHAILQKNSNTFVVPDALEDWRFAHNPLVRSSPFIRFYAGAQLITPDGFKLGSLCVIDDKPRYVFTQQDRQYLVNAAAQVIDLMEKHHDVMREEMNVEMERSLLTFSDEIEKTRRALQVTMDNKIGMRPLLESATKLILDSLRLENVYIMRLSNGKSASPKVSSIASSGQFKENMKFDANMHVQALSQREGLIYQYADGPVIAKQDETGTSGLILPLLVFSPEDSGLLLNLFARDTFRVFEAHDVIYVQRFVALLASGIQHMEVSGIPVPI